MRILISASLILLSSLSLVSAQQAPNENPFTLESRYSKAISSLSSAVSEEDRFYALTETALTSFEVGKIEDSKKYAEELLSLAPRYKSNWNYGNAIHKGNMALGRIALKNGDMDLAKSYLIKSGKTRGSPQLDSFGPNMTFAKELLEVGEKDIVIQYLNLCRNFWKMDRDRLDFWIFQVQRGKTPDFGAHLLY